MLLRVLSSVGLLFLHPKSISYLFVWVIKCCSFGDIHSGIALAVTQWGSFVVYAGQTE